MEDMRITSGGLGFEVLIGIGLLAGWWIFVYGYSVVYKLFKRNFTCFRCGTDYTSKWDHSRIFQVCADCAAEDD